MAKKWRDVQREVKQLYLIENKPLEEVRTLLKEKYDFDRSIRAYKTQLEKWQYQKYRRARRLATRASSPGRSRDQKSTGPGMTELVLSSQPETDTAILLGMEQELQRQTTLAREQGAALRLARQPLSPLQQATKTEEIDKSIAKIAKIEETIHSMRKSIEAMCGVKFARVPTGLDSCWKKEPMTLEDAHGNLLPIPIELVGSWEMFEDILTSHFRTLPGSRKVLRREYAIEDSSTRCTFSKKQPWSFFSKPGRKIDMSMIFKNAGNTVVCPKCNTISKEKKGVLVECKVPGCKMLFRTESQQPTGRTQILSDAHSRNGNSGQEGDNEVEDRPGIFKRVIIRVPEIPHIQQQHEGLNTILEDNTGSFKNPPNPKSQTSEPIPRREAPPDAMHYLQSLFLSDIPPQYQKYVNNSNILGYANGFETDSPLSLNTFQQPFPPQDIWQMPMSLEWDWANMTNGLVSQQDLWQMPMTLDWDEPVAPSQQAAQAHKAGDAGPGDGTVDGPADSEMGNL